MTKLQQSLIEKLYPMLDGENKIYRQMVDYLLSLGYWPQKLKKKDFSLYFIHSGKKIAKIEFPKEGIEFLFKFNACKSVPAWCINALLHEEGLPTEADDKWYHLSTKKCDYSDCSTCGAVKYSYVAKNGGEIFRCTSGAIPLRDIDAIDIDDFKKLATEQHEFFMSLPPSK